jgi:hypothetical protein
MLKAFGKVFFIGISPVLIVFNQWLKESIEWEINADNRLFATYPQKWKKMQKKNWG